MTEEKELTKIERELVLQYLIDDNVPLTVTLEEKPEKADAELAGEKTSLPEKESRLPASAVFPVAIPSEQITVLSQGIILLKNPARTVRPFIGKQVRVQFYFNRLGLYFLTEMKECSKGLAIVIPSAIRRLPELVSGPGYALSGAVSYESANARISISCIPLPGYRLLESPKWTDIPEACRSHAKALLESFVQESRSGRAEPAGNGLHLLAVARCLASEQDTHESEPVEGRAKPFYLIFADDKRIVLALKSGSEKIDLDLSYDLSLDFALPGNRLFKRTVRTGCQAETVYSDGSGGMQCVSLKYTGLQEEDRRFLCEQVKGSGAA